MMEPRSFFRYLALSALCSIVYAQAPLNAIPLSGTSVEGAAPAQEEPTGDVAACGGCQLVADVAGLVWYSQVFINTAATELVSVGVANGTRATRTSVVQDEGEFTFNPAATANGGALTQVNFEPSITVGGAVLTSPTAYNVFTAYTVTSAFNSDGRCVTTSEERTLDSAYSQILPSANGQVVLDAAGQKSFIDFLGFSTCSGGGENFNPTALVQVTNTTATQTNTFTGLQAQQSISLSIATPVSAAPRITRNATFPSVGIPEIVIGNTTITPTPNPIGLPVYNGTTFSSLTGFPGPTGSIVPFVAGASSMSKTNAWLVAWVVGFMGFGVGVYYL